MYYNGIYTGNHPSRVVQTPNGPVTIVYLNRNMYYPNYGSDYALGALTGAAVASTLTWPLFFPMWFPLFWC